MMSSAQDSLAITGLPSKSPRQSGRTPKGSRNPTTFLPVSTAAEKAPRMRLTASRTEPEQVVRGVLGDERGDDLGVGARLEADAQLGELVAQLGGVDEVAVVGEGDGVLAARARERLRVLPGRRTGRGVAHVADGVRAGEAGEHLLVEDLRDEAHVLDDRDLAFVGHGDAGALLAAMLQGVEPEEGEPGDVAARRVDAKDAAAVVKAVARHGLIQASRSGSDS